MLIRLVGGGAVVALALAGCASHTTATPGGDATSQAASSGSVAAGVPAKGDKPSREFVVGKWGTDGDCMLAIDLRPDGTSDGPFENWSYSDGVISFPEEPDITINVTVVDKDTMQTTNDSGMVSKMTRCP